MTARLLATCSSEIHFPEDGTGRSCSLAHAHAGAHWSMRPIGAGAWRPISWEGDDRLAPDGAPSRGRA